MKIVFALLLILSLFVFASEKYGVYDLRGNRISTFEAELHELPEKTRQIKADNSHRKLYVSAMRKGRGSKPTSRYRYKIETGAYIEASRKETFSICPDEIQGTWISEYSVSLNEENCVSIQAPNLAGTFQILFAQNNDRTDTIKVLVEQSYIQMEDYSHKMWVTDLKHERQVGGFTVTGPALPNIENNGHYENRSYNQPLIVDKTKLTMGDAQYYYKIYNAVDNIMISRFTLEKKEYKGKKLEESELPLIGVYQEWKFANARSKKEGLDTAYIRIDPRSKDAEKLILLGDPIHGSCESCTVIALDTSASGYRSPFEEEWFFLMRAGASTRYYWGDEEDSRTVSRYAWVRPVGLQPVAKLLPNRFGLYDIVGIADEHIHYFDKEHGYWDSKMSCANFYFNFECHFINEIGAQEEYVDPPRTVCEFGSNSMGNSKCTTKKEEIETRRVYYQGLRLIRKTQKLHKLEKL
ncbi:MAG: formylglycine-generating enzyme family protein [Fibromonadaceae bacterium]|jgi:hypothetical protein|nr:formylglycine-generating enzyme family protein [Fibromonadaceae bacterium]